MAVDVATVTGVTPSVGDYVSLFLPIVGLVLIIIIIWYKIAKNMAKIAADKGYTEKKWFHYCFWLGIVGILMVCAMPDKNLHRQ